MQLVDWLTKDSYKYVQYGLMHFIDQTNETVPLILGRIMDDLEKIHSNSHIEVDHDIQSIMEWRKDFKNLKGNLSLITMLLILV